MSLTLAAVEVELNLAAKIRTRMAEGASTWELAVEEMPSWLATAVGDATVEAVFVSGHAAVAILEGGRQVVRRAPIN